MDLAADIQQACVLERVNSVLKSLHPDSLSFSAILNEAQSYQRSMRT
ncbi:MAG TPA: hypothetical protein VIK21_00605 [Desulfuromonadaceae bacterium]